jgi:hypothetical protein
MIDRLGSFLYWAGSAFSALLVLAAVTSLLFGQADGRYVTISIELALAELAWLVGRVCRYVLAGQ